MAEIPVINTVTLDSLMERSKNRGVVPISISGDIALNGGIPWGCSGIVAGREKTGKTTLTLQAAANALEKFPDAEVWYYNKERRLTAKVISQIHGLQKNKDRFHIVEPPKKTTKSGEEIGNETWSSQQWLTILGDQLQNSRRQFIIFDSISSLASEKQLEEQVGHEDRGASKKVETSFYQKFGDLVVCNEHIVLFIAQGYANTSGYGKNFVVKIGSSLKYQADLIACVTKIEKWDDNKDHGGPLGHDMVMYIEENPLGFPHQEIKIPLRYGHGIDEEKDIIEQGINFGLIKKGGAWITFACDEKGNAVELTDPNAVKKQAIVPARNFLVANPTVKESLDKQIRAMVFSDET